MSEQLASHLEQTKRKWIAKWKRLSDVSFQLSQWVEHIASWLRPIYEAMWQAMFAGGYLQVDETPVRVMDPEVQGKAARGYLWFYAVPHGGVILDFDRSRGMEPAKRRLKNFKGTIQTDAYEVYQSLGRNQEGLERIGCLAHSRSRFYAALKENLADAIWFIRHFRTLYRIEEETRHLTVAARHALRQQKAPGIWETLKAKTSELQPKFPPKSTMGKALSYFVNEYEALIGYMRDGRYEIDNNLVENAIRPTAVGRKRWLFIGHPNAGWRSAVIYSIIVSCRRRGINRQDNFSRSLSSPKDVFIDAILLKTEFVDKGMTCSSSGSGSVSHDGKVSTNSNGTCSRTTTAHYTLQTNGRLYILQPKIKRPWLALATLGWLGPRNPGAASEPH